MENNSFRSEYSSLGTFFVLELLALVCFGLGGVNQIFQYVGFIVALVATYFAFANYSKDDLKPVLLLGIPLVLLAIFVSFGKYFNESSILENLGIFLAIPSFFAVGLSYRRIKKASFRNLVLCIGGGFALLTLIGMFATWVQYGFFYPLVYKATPAYYYNGTLYSIANEMNWLVGFQITEVPQNYGGLFALMCASFLPGILFIDRKKDLVLFVAFIVFGSIGILSMITIPNIPALIITIVVYSIAAYYRFLRHNKIAQQVLHYVIPVIAGGIAAFILFAILNVNVSGVHDFISKSSLLDRLFNSNRYMVEINPIIEAVFKPSNIFGIDLVNYVDGYRFDTKYITRSTGVFEADIMKEGGIIAFVILLFVIVVGYETFSRYLKTSKDKDYVKVIILSLMSGMFIYLTFFSETTLQIHSDYGYQPFTRSTAFLIMIFILGFVTLPSNKGEIEFKEIDRIKKERRVVDEDYEFNDIIEEEII